MRSWTPKSRISDHAATSHFAQHRQRLRQKVERPASGRVDLQLPLLRAAGRRGDELPVSNKVIGENETGFRGRDDLLYRTEAWDFLLAGGALYNNLDYSFTPDHPDGTFREYRSPGGGSAELRAQLGWLKRFVEGFDFLTMSPHPGVVSGVEPALSVQALVEEGRQYAIYLHVPLPKKPENLAEHMRTAQEAVIRLELPPGRYTAEWLDPTTGRVQDPETFTHTDGTRRLTTPTFDNDIALSLVATDL